MFLMLGKTAGCQPKGCFAFVPRRVACESADSFGVYLQRFLRIIAVQSSMVLQNMCKFCNIVLVLVLVFYATLVFIRSQ